MRRTLSWPICEVLWGHATSDQLQGARGDFWVIGLSTQVQGLSPHVFLSSINSLHLGEMKLNNNPDSLYHHWIPSSMPTQLWHGPSFTVVRLHPFQDLGDGRPVLIFFFNSKLLLLLHPQQLAHCLGTLGTTYLLKAGWMSEWMNTLIAGEELYVIRRWRAGPHDSSRKVSQTGSASYMLRICKSQQRGPLDT